MRSPTPNDSAADTTGAVTAPKARSSAPRTGPRASRGSFEANGPRTRVSEVHAACRARTPSASEVRVEGGRVDQQAFEDVAMPAQVGAAHPASVVNVSEGPPARRHYPHRDIAAGIDTP